MAGPVRQVHFYAIEALEESKPLAFSGKKVLEKINTLKGESGEAYLKTGLFEHLLGLVHGQNEAAPMLSVWNVDTVNAPFFERKGAVAKHHMMEDEGVADPAYLMFFDDRFMALLRPAPRSPGPTVIAEYINHFTKANCCFATLVQPDVLRQLQRPAEDVVRTTLRIKVRNLAKVKESRADVEAALRAAAAPTESTEVTVIWKAALKTEKARWWALTRPIMRELVLSGAIDVFETATVTMAGGRPVDLLQQHLTERVAVDMLPGEKHVSPEAAAQALAWAYQQRRADLVTAYDLQYGQ